MQPAIAGFFASGTLQALSWAGWYKTRVFKCT